MNRLLSITVVLCAFLVVPSLAQDKDCEQILIQADDEFNAGRFFGIPALLKACLENGFSNEQKIRAYLILTQAHLILDEPAAADESYLKLLKADPEYQASQYRDPIDVYYLSKKFTSTPVFTPHFRAGLNTSRPRLIQEVTTSGTPLDKREVYKVGFQVGGGVDWNIDDHWSVGIEGNFFNKGYGRETVGFSKSDLQQTTERQTGLDLPLYVKYSDDSGKVRPFAYAGFALSYMISSKVSLQFEDRTPSETLQDGVINVSVSVKPAPASTENVRYERNVFNRALVLGGGVKFKRGKDFVYVDLRYMAGLSNFVNVENNYYLQSGKMEGTLTAYQYVSDLLRLDNLSLSIGYIRPIYNPRKKTKPRFVNLFKKKSKSE
jgi:Outer membrane protein beta-barrel domain